MQSLRITAVRVAIAIVVGSWLFSPGLSRAAPQKEVVVVNDASEPVLVEDVDNPARRPFNRTVQLDNASGGQGYGTTIDAPSDDQLVIEFLSASCSSQAGIEPTKLRVFAGVEHYFWLENLAFGVGFSSTATHMTRMYPNPGSPMNFSVFPSTNQATINCTLSITGYLIAP